MKYKALIIGAGSIGALKPSEFDSPESKQIYTHAHACYSHPDIELVGIVDININKAVEACLKWNSTPFPSVKYGYECLEVQENVPDIAIVAVDTKNHIQVINDLIPYKPKVIICEKPFCLNHEQAYNIAWKCKEHGIHLIINYLRGFVPELKQLSNDLKSGVYGDIYNFTLRYSRGIKRDGSHALYWCLNTFGKVGINTRHDHKYLHDNTEDNDYNIHFYYQSNLCPVVSFIPIGSAYSTYNADIYTEKGRIELLDNWSTIRFHESAMSTYGNYRATGLLFNDKTTQLDQALTYLLDEAISRIGTEANDPDFNALQVHKLLTI
jgi:predicted dehydrogenase